MMLFLKNDKNGKNSTNNSILQYIFNTSPWITFLKVNVFVIFHSALCMIDFKLGDPSGGADTCKGTEWGSVHIDHLSDSNSDSD